MIDRPRPSSTFIRIASAALGIAILLDAPPAARAEELHFQAKQAEYDPALKRITLQHKVFLQYNRYHLRSEGIRIQTRDGAIELEGESILSFCPCDDAPISFALAGAKLFPEGDITLRFPRLLFYGTPVFALPWLWIRTPMQVGLLPPQFAWRGRDGFWLGSGVRLPFWGADRQARALEMRAAAYVQGGAELGLRFSGPGFENRMAWDFYRNASQNSRFWAAAQGNIPLSGQGASILWDVDAIRGERARARTPDFDQAIQKYDRMDAASLPWRSSWGLALTGLDARAARADGPVYGGPRALLNLGGEISRFGAWDALAEMRVWGNDMDSTAMAMLRAGGGAEAVTRPGPLVVEASFRGRLLGNTEKNPKNDPIAGDAMGWTKARIGLPLQKFFGLGEKAWVHEIHPYMEGMLVLGSGVGVPAGLGQRPKGSLEDGLFVVGAGGVENSLGRPGTAMLRAQARLGWLQKAGNQADVGRGIGLITFQAEGTWTAGWAELAGARAEGGELHAAIAGWARMGRKDGLNLRLEGFSQRQEDAAVARLLAGGPAGGPVMGEQPYAAGAGTAAGGRLWIPWTHSLSTWLRGAVEADSPRLLGISGGVWGRHPCGCADVSFGLSYRKGREGLDASLLIDLWPSRKGWP